MKFVWLERNSEHHELGLLVTGETYEAPAKLAEEWIKQGAAAPVAPAHDAPAAAVAVSTDEQEG
jgi:hypothetical protein